MGEENEQNRCKGEKKENLGDLLMEGTVQNFQDLVANMGIYALELFDVCKWNISPLMVACLLGFKDIVKFLLGKGANPNEKCTEEMNTPLHYACLLREYIEESGSQSEWYFKCEEDTVTKKEEIIKLLFDHGAVLEKNSLGCLPLHCAALFAMEKIVDVFIDKEQVTSSDRLLAMEMLGVAQTVAITDYSKAYSTFLATLLIRQDIGCELSPFPSELGQHLKYSECTTFNELHKLKYDHSSMYIYSMLVGERVLPEKLKQKYLWPKMFCPDSYEMEKFVGACQYGLTLEMNSRLVVGTVLNGIRDLLLDVDYCDIQGTMLIEVMACLEKYNEILKIVESEHIADRSFQFSLAFGIILRELVMRFLHNRQTFDALYKVTVDVMSVYYEQTSAFETTYSVAMKCLDNVRDLYDPTFLNDRDMRIVLTLWNHVLPFLLKHEQKVHLNASSSETMLHMTMDLLELGEDFDVICAITRKLVRHGCPIDAKAYGGKTAKDMALSVSTAQDFEVEHPEFDEILALLSKPSEVLSLQELSARCVLRSRIPYSLGTVPVTLYDFLNGEDFMQTEMFMD